MKNRIKFLAGILVITIGILSCSSDDENTEPEDETIIPEETLRTETFSFAWGGVNSSQAKIYLPDAYDTNSNLPVIYLIDYQEQHFTVATDEFEQVINGVNEIANFDALVVTLAVHANIDAVPGSYQNHIRKFKGMISYVDNNYTNNPSRTFIGRGSEAGIVLLSLVNEDPDVNIFDNYIATDSPWNFNNHVIAKIQSGNIPENMTNKKLHFSYSISNNQISCNELIDSFVDAQYPWLQFEDVHYNTSNYDNTYPTAFTAGLEFVFN